ncbi:MAG: efflux RND transporter periplasmic adaptor subunit [Phycisphaerales bacterium]|nr:efflux RND transporter periplasmic adaptor subunit [Phycisphaerales bacterium]
MKTMTTRYSGMMCFLLLLLSVLGCEQSDVPVETQSAEAMEAQLPSDRVAIPLAVRSNLGITFATVERRQIENTLRAPGRFEYLPTAARQYHLMLTGRVELLVEQFENVEVGTPLYRIDSPHWREIQQSIAAADAELKSATAELWSFEPLMAAHERHEHNLARSIGIWSDRVKKLEALQEAGGGQMTELIAAQASLADSRAELSEVHEEDAKLRASRIQTENKIDAAQSQFTLAIENAASLLDMDPKQLMETSTLNPNSLPIWRRIQTLEIQAKQQGVVESIDVTNGAWVERGSNVMTVVQPDRLRFHAFGLQSDLGILEDGLPVTIVPPAPTATGSAIPIHDTMTGTLQIGLKGNASDRTIDLYIVPDELAAWARPGVTAQAEIITESTDMSELAIPMAAVQQDGLIPVIFRRDPGNPNQAIRMEADLGMDDDRWVAVLSGLRDGDEVVLDGGFQLMLAMSGTIQKGGHFHADGTYHEGDH